MTFFEVTGIILVFGVLCLLVPRASFIALAGIVAQNQGIAFVKGASFVLTVAIVMGVILGLIMDALTLLREFASWN